MEQGTPEQIINLIDKSRNILLLTHAKADCDGLGAMLSAYMVLKKLGKNVTVVTNDPAPENLSFLPSVKIIQNSLSSAKDFVITLDLTNTPLHKVKYNVEDDKLNIIVTPKGGIFTRDDVSFAEGDNPFDLIIVMDAGNLEHLGPIYDKNTKLFFEAPVINIDHHASNTDFGQINMVDTVAASTTEVLFRVLKAMEKKYDKKLIDEDVATLLLAGIITDTGSFQHANTSPRAMEVSAELLDLGARQQEIIRNIYKTKKLSTLKLWGIILSKIQVDPLHRMVWSTITKEDLQEAGAQPDESEGIIDDLLSNAPGAEVMILIKYNEENLISVSMRSNTNAVDVGKIAAEMGGGGHVRAAGFKVRDGRPFDEVVSQVLKKVRGYQAERLNIHPDTPTIMPAGESSAVGRGFTPSKKDDEPKPQEKKEVKTTPLEFKAPKQKSPSAGGQTEVPVAKAPEVPAPPEANKPVKPKTKASPPASKKPEASKHEEKKTMPIGRQAEPVKRSEAPQPDKMPAEGAPKPQPKPTPAPEAPKPVTPSASPTPPPPTKPVEPKPQPPKPVISASPPPKPEPPKPVVPALTPKPMTPPSKPEAVKAPEPKPAETKTEPPKPAEPPKPEMSPKPDSGPKEEPPAPGVPDWLKAE